MVEFDELHYSTEAKNLTHQFYEVDRIVYVEGDEDALFWQILLKKFQPEVLYEFIQVGGKLNLKSYMEEIESGDAEFLVALDSDFDFITTNEIHPQIIRTFGYSIENTIVCANSVSKVIQLTAKLSSNSSDSFECEQWLSELMSSTEGLLAYDIENERLGKGNVVLGINFDRLAISKNDCSVCPTKIEKLINDLNFEITTEKQEEVLLTVRNKGFTVLDLLKGHFLFSAASRYIGATIRKRKKSASIPNDLLFTSLLLAFESLFDTDHKHFDHYRKTLT